MFDCANVEMRELLPELVAGTLDADTRTRVEAHALGCAECASELETLRLVRASFADAPAVDTARIVAALPRPLARATVSPPRSRRVNRWMDWRVAAALTMVTVGGLSVVVTRQTPNVPAVPVIDTPKVSQLDSTLPVGDSVSKPKGTDTAGAATKGTRAVNPRLARAELELGGSSDGELDDAALRALLGALDEIDRGPVAPSAEPDGSPVLPVIREGAR